MSTLRHRPQKQPICESYIRVAITKWIFQVYETMFKLNALESARKTNISRLYSAVISAKCFYNIN